MEAQELRDKYIKYFVEKKHAKLDSASVIPENDASVLFTTAGMHPLVPYLMGEEHPKGKRLVSIQKCIRTNDIDEVGDATHLTFFEMMGNWSLGDYFKEESIKMSYEFLIDVLNKSISKYRFQKKYNKYKTCKYFNCKSIQFKIYDKEQERICKGKSIEKYEENVLRLEIALRNRHLNYKKYIGRKKELKSYLNNSYIINPYIIYCYN